MNNVYIERDSDEYVSRYSMKRVKYHVKATRDPAPRASPTARPFILNLDEVIRKILLNVKNDEAPFVKYKIGTKLSVNRGSKSICIEFRHPQGLTREVINQRLMYLTQSNESVDVEELQIEFTFFK